MRGCADGAGEREAAGLLSSSRMNNNGGGNTRSQEMVYHAAEEVHQTNDSADDQPRRRSVNYRTDPSFFFLILNLRRVCRPFPPCPFRYDNKQTLDV